MAKKRRARKTTTKPKKKKTSRRPRKRRSIVRARVAAAVAVQFAGFDTGSYPGDAAIRAWAAQSPYRFVGFYFDAPCHTTARFKTWSGKYPLIKSSGLGLIIIYVGLQQDGCGQAGLSRARGLKDGGDTAAKFAVEGFPDDAVVFLDIEHYDGALSAPMEAYVTGWLSAILDAGRITPWIYCPASKAGEIRLAAGKEFAAHGQPGSFPVFWVAKVDPLFDPSASVPAGSGVSFASAWQGRLDMTDTHGGVTIRIDQNVADTPDPSTATTDLV
jgi:hypothetical protein